MGIEDTYISESLNRIQSELNSIWINFGARPELVEVMRQSLSLDYEKADMSNVSSRIAVLPELCYEAAGGQHTLADDLSIAFLLFHRAAGLMDKIQDQDEPDPWWLNLSPGLVLNAASGLYFTASLALNNLYKSPVEVSVISEIVDSLYSGFFTVCSGQHSDLMSSRPSLDQYWEIAGAKSGAFFSTACYVGARLATDDLYRLNGFRKFGYHLGVLIQILDDLEGFRSAHVLNASIRSQDSYHSLPIIYALEVYPSSIQSHLHSLLAASQEEDSKRTKDALEIINQSGVVTYVEVEINRQVAEARSGLDQAKPDSFAGEMLHSLLSSLAPI